MSLLLLRGGGGTDNSKKPGRPDFLSLARRSPDPAWLHGDLLLPLRANYRG